MDYEKLHKDTINKLQQMVNSGKITVETARGICADFVPEPEDERIRKALIELVHDTTGDSLWVDYNVHKEDALAWLEKQGKNIGISEATKQKLEDNLNKALEKETPDSWNEFLDKQKPAELPKGEDYGIDGLYAAIDILTKTLGEVDGYQSDDGILEHKYAISAVKELSKQKLAWSEEDESMFSQISDILWEGYKNSTGEKMPTWDNIREWCLSIKDRVQPQQKQEWSEEDSNMLQSILDEYKSMAIEKRNWLKSLRPQSQWKPSDEQIEALETTLYTNMSRNDERYSVLSKFVTELKKLKSKL